MNFTFYQDSDTSPCTCPVGYNLNQTTLQCDVIDTSLNANDSGTQTNVVGIVVGSVIGGIVLIAAVVAGSCVYYKHKKKE